MALQDDERRAWFRREILPLEPMLLRVASQLTRRGGDAEDLVHEAYARIITYESWRSIENIPAFAARILRNLAFDNARRAQIVAIEVVADIDQVAGCDEAPNPETITLGRDELRHLIALIEELPPQCRRVFTLRKVYDLSQREIAERLGLSVNTVEKHLVKGLRFCSERLARNTGKRKASTIVEGPWGKKRDRREI